jgi:hypothetical protein
MKNISLRQGPNDNKMHEDTILEINEYIIPKGNIPLTFFISKTKNYVIIRSIFYELKLNPNDFSKITKDLFRSVDEIYQFLKNIFEKKNIIIPEISNKMMKLIISFLGFGQGAMKKIEIYLPCQKEINGYVINDIFSKYLRLEEENIKIKEENSKLKSDILKIKNEMAIIQAQNKANENHINLLISGIDKINNFIDTRTNEQNPEVENKENQENIKKSMSLTKSYSVNQNLNIKNKNMYQSFNTNYSTQTNPNQVDRSNFEQNLDIYGEEQLFRTEDGRVIFRNGLLNGIIKKYSEINNVVNKIQEILKKGAKFKIIYKAVESGDKASIFHQKCDSIEMSLVIIETIKGVRFGGFTTRPWEGNCVQKIDNEAFVFSIDKKKIYDIIPNEPAVGCYPKFGPVFFGCQIRIYDNFFKKASTTCHRRLNYKTTQDYELNNCEQSFIVKDIEVYSIEAIEV